ncbi:hypothetical protein LJ753_02505 [Arthrobacter sp. zg-Y20]|uniref:hypothetical protein n=1 Tax=unclassified Arthrobacter TaxID=235627 RepID=UPI001D1437DF|nr:MULTISPECIES: hypothetical protein [unclassified Arthrobacter]MCC3274743.1 hypothetical protein [Arthrobacter sp. zg-Y20]MDK1314899.1 hypothetical protein [Arthrobacter sp. zg.Y20]WIB04756.1 hypothetical protein QNO06_09250 [Arthrobacter sp. zg-Y20]
MRAAASHQRDTQQKSRFRWLPRVLRGPEAWPAGIGLVFCAVAAWAVLGNLFDPHFGFSRYRTGWSLAAVAAFLVLSAVAYLVVGRTARLAGRHRAWRVLAGALVWTALFAAQMRVAYAVRLPPDWDVFAIHESAAGLAGGTLTAVTPYFQINPNNLLLTLLLAAYYALVLALGLTDLAMAAAFLNSLVLFAATVLTYCAARMLAGPKAAALTILPAAVFLTFSPWAGVLYSDTAGALFPVLVLCLLLASCHTRRVYLKAALWILAGGLGAIGTGIKPTVVFCLIAAGITVLCMLARRRNTAVLLAAVAVVAGSFLIGNRLIFAFMQHTPVVAFDLSNNPDAMNPGHFLKVGAQTAESPNGPYYGSYNQSDYEDTVAIHGSSAKFQAGLDTYLERVDAMGAGGYAEFLADKLLWVTGDGSFFAWGEGRLTGADFLSNLGADRALQDLLGNTGAHFQWMLSIWQGTWFAVLALAAVPLLLRTRHLLRPEFSAMRICLLGLLVFLLFFEGRARFLYLYVPYFIILASVSCAAVLERLRQWKHHAKPAAAGDRRGSD